MQPITQASLDPKLNDIRHLRAAQSLEGVLDCPVLSPTHPLFRTSHNWFESYRLHGRGSVPNRNMQNPSVLAAHRDSKNDSNLGARREIQRRTTPCTELHGRYRKPKQLARNAKKPGKPLVLQHGLQKANGEDRNRTIRCFPNVLRVIEMCRSGLALGEPPSSCWGWFDPKP